MAARHRLPADLADAQARLTAIYEARESNPRWDTLRILIRDWTPTVEPPTRRNVIDLLARARQRLAARGEERDGGS